MESKKPTLIKKLAEVMNEVGKIPKNGENKFHHYKYVMESDLVEAIRDKLAARHVFITSCTKGIEVVDLSKSNKQGEILPTKIGVLRVDYTFHDGESGETLTMESIGEIDQDGGKGLYKALTGSMKYFLMKNFLVATGDDPEQDAPVATKPSVPSKSAPTKAPIPVATPEAKPTVKCPAVAGDKMRSAEQAKELMALWHELMNLRRTDPEKQAGVLEQVLLRNYGVKSMNSLRNKQASHMFDDLIAAIEAEKKKSAPATTTEEDVADAEREGMKVS